MLAADSPREDRADIDKWAGDQIARTANLNCNQGHAYVSLAQETRDRLAPGFDALARGEIDYQKLQILSSQCLGLTDETTIAVQQKVLRATPRCGATDFRRRTRRQVLRLDPRTAQQRRIEAEQRRKLTYHPGNDGQAVLVLHGPAIELRPLYDRAQRLAKATPRAGRTLDQITYDILRDMLLSQTIRGANTEATLNITVELATLLELDDEPAELDGHGPIPAALAREIADKPNTYFRRLTTIDGHLVHLSDRYRPTGSQAAYCTLRDTTCPWPGCNHPSSSGDLDHGKPYGTTGITDTSDLVGWCRRHHLLKTLGYFHWTRNADGSFTITLHDGTTFDTSSRQRRGHLRERSA